jgi:hypothetical protein
MVSALILAAALAAPITDSAPPVRLWLNSDGRFRPGDRPRAYVQAAEDGYLVVLRADAEGRVRVLFPAGPSDDNFVHGGRKLEIRWPNAAEATYLGGRPAVGTVVAVWSPDPFKFDEFVRNDHWDYRVLGAKKVDDDPEAGLVDIAQRMASGSQVDSDVATYSFGMWRAPGYGRGWGYPWHSGVRLGVSFGSPFYDPFCYDPFWGYGAFACPGYGYRYGYGYGYGFGGFYYRTPRFYRQPFYVRSQTAPRFIMPRDRVRVTPIEPRTRSRSVERSPAPRVSMPAPRASGRGWSRPAPASRGTSRGAATPRSRRH